MNPRRIEAWRCIVCLNDYSLDERGRAAALVCCMPNPLTSVIYSKGSKLDLKGGYP